MPIYQPERPERMLTSERVVQPEFPGDEHLYRRFLPAHFVNGQLTNVGLSFPRFSVNRQRFSEPDDVLWHDEEDRRFDGWGVFAVSVADASLTLATGDARELVFGLLHDPLPLNYSHSVVECIDRGSGDEISRPSRAVQKAYRISLSRVASANIVIEPASAS